jgi:hypothetical protein
MVSPKSTYTGETFWGRGKSTGSIIFQSLLWADLPALKQNTVHPNLPAISVLRAVFQNVSDSLF